MSASPSPPSLTGGLIGRIRNRDKHHKSQLDGHIGVRFALPPPLQTHSHTYTNTANQLTLPSHLPPITSTSPSASKRGSQTERSHRATTGANHFSSLPSPSSSKAISGSHFPATDQIKPASSSTVTHPRFVRLLNELETEVRRHQQQQQQQQQLSNEKEEEKPATAISSSRASLHSPTPPSLPKVDLSNVEHFDLIQQQIHSQFEQLLSDHTSALLRRFQLDMQKQSNRAEFSQVELEKQHQSTLAAVSLAHSQRAAKLMADYKTRLQSLTQGATQIDSERLRFFESAYPQLQEAIQRERGEWERVRQDWERSYEKLAHKYQTVLQHTNQISQVVREQRDITLQLETQLLAAGITPILPNSGEPISIDTVDADAAYGQSSLTADDHSPSIDSSNAASPLPTAAPTDSTQPVSNDTNPTLATRPFSSMDTAAITNDHAPPSPSTSSPSLDSAAKSDARSAFVRPPNLQIPPSSVTQSGPSSTSNMNVAHSSSASSLNLSARSSVTSSPNSFLSPFSSYRMRLDQIASKPPVPILIDHHAQTPTQWRLALPLHIASMLPFEEDDGNGGQVAADIVDQPQHEEAANDNHAHNKSADSLTIDSSILSPSQSSFSSYDTLLSQYGVQPGANPFENFSAATATGLKIIISTGVKDKEKEENDQPTDGDPDINRSEVDSIAHSHTNITLPPPSPSRQSIHSKVPVTDNVSSASSSKASRIRSVRSPTSQQTSSHVRRPIRSNRFSLSELPHANQDNGETTVSNSGSNKNPRKHSTKPHKRQLKDDTCIAPAPAVPTAIPSATAPSTIFHPIGRSMSMPYGVKIDPTLFDMHATNSPSMSGSTTGHGDGSGSDSFHDDALASFDEDDIDIGDAYDGSVGNSPRGVTETIETLAERWKQRLLSTQVQLSRARGKNEALAVLLKSSNDRNSILTQALQLSKTKQQRLTEEIALATKNGTDLVNHLRLQTSTRRQDLIVKLNESETELMKLREDLLQLREQQIDFNKQSFTISVLRNDLAKQVKRAERSQSTADKWKSQMDESLQLVKQLQAELVAAKEEHHAAMRRLKKRLVLKSIWFRTQLMKLDRLQELCLGLDQYLRPELTCPSCLELLKYPQSLSPCGHSMCAQCVNSLKHNRQGPVKNIVCYECKRECESTAPNFILEGVLSRYHWWTMLLKDFHTNKTLTLEQEQGLKYMTVKDGNKEDR